MDTGVLVARAFLGLAFLSVARRRPAPAAAGPRG
jgi:hypothetical protein